MKFERSGGILLHPTSLPGPDGIGDLGPDAYTWIQQIKEMGNSLWQILPIGPTGYGDSPYQCFSAFAGNPLLISLLLLVEDGLLTVEDLSDRPFFNAVEVQYGEVIGWKNKLLDKAFINFKKKKFTRLQNEFEIFRENEAHWLEDYSLFMAIKQNQDGAPWFEWPNKLKRRETVTIQKFANQQKRAVERYQFRQFLFHRQWNDLKQFAEKSAVKIIGDIPIFVAHDSTDAWANPELFHFDEDLNPTVVAGVPPDYYSKTGQLWGNPLYRWDFHKEQGYKWWVQRVESTLHMVDIIRLDHFRGFVDYWEIPAGMPTAEIGEWKPGPGKELFDAITQMLGELPIIAEDLGQINPDVFVLRDELGLPGMKLLQFAFGNDAENEFLPHNFPHNCVAYTGTHDNDTTVGWYQSAPESEKDFCRRYLAASGQDIAWEMIREIWSSVSIFAIAPLQDFLRKGSEARMNYPGRAAGNWSWRFQPEEIGDNLVRDIYELNKLYGRGNR